MKRKVLSLLLCGLLACGMLTACGGSGKVSTNEVPATEEKEPEVEMAADEAQPVTEASDIDEASTEEVYTVSRYSISNELQDFFTLWLGCQLDWALDNEQTEVKDMDTMLKHGGVVGSISANKNLHVVYEYDNSQFVGLSGASNAVYVALGSKKNVDYSTSVSIPLANFEEYRYYKGTDAILSVVANVTCNIDNEPVKFKYDTNKITFGVTLVNNQSNPEEWLITGIYFLDVAPDNDEVTEELVKAGSGSKSSVWNNQAFKAEENGFDVSTKLVSEDTQEAMNNVNEQLQSSELTDWKQIYADYFLNYSDEATISGYDIYDVNNDGIPEIFAGNGGVYPYLFYINASGEVEKIGLHQYASILDNGKICSESVGMGEQHDSVYLYNDATKKFELIFDGYVKDCDLETATYFISEKQCNADEYNRQFEQVADGEAIYFPEGQNSGGTTEIAEAILSY